MHDQFPDLKRIKIEGASSGSNGNAHEWRPREAKNEIGEKKATPMKKRTILSLPVSCVKVIKPDNNNVKSERCDPAAINSDDGNKLAREMEEPLEKEVKSQNVLESETEKDTRSIWFGEFFEEDNLVHEGNEGRWQNQLIPSKSSKNDTNVESEPTKASRKRSQAGLVGTIKMEGAQREGINSSVGLMETDDDILTSLIEFPDPLVPSFLGNGMDFEDTLAPRGTSSVQNLNDKRNAISNSNSYVMTDLDAIFNTLNPNTCAPSPEPKPTSSRQMFLLETPKKTDKSSVQLNGIKREADVKASSAEKRPKPSFQMHIAEENHETEVNQFATNWSSSKGHKNDTAKLEGGQGQSMQKPRLRHEATVQMQQETSNYQLQQPTATDNVRAKPTAQALLQKPLYNVQQQQQQQHRLQNVTLKQDMLPTTLQNQFGNQRQQLENQQHREMHRFKITQLDSHNFRVQRIQPRIQYNQHQPQPNQPKPQHNRWKPQPNQQQPLPNQSQLQHNQSLQHFSQQQSQVYSNQRRPQLHQQQQLPETHLNQQQPQQSQQQLPAHQIIQQGVQINQQQKLMTNSYAVQQSIKHEHDKSTSYANGHVAFHQQKNTQQHQQRMPQQQPKVEAQHQYLQQQQQQHYVQKVQQQTPNPQKQSQQINVNSNQANIQNGLRAEAQKRLLRLSQYPKLIRMLLSKEQRKREQSHETVQQQIRSDISSGEKKDLMLKYAKDARKSSLLVKQLNHLLIKLHQFEKVRHHRSKQTISNRPMLKQATQNSFSVAPDSSQMNEAQNARVKGVMSEAQRSNKIKQVFLVNSAKQIQQIMIPSSSSTGPSQVNKHGMTDVRHHPYTKPFTQFVQSQQGNQMPVGNFTQVAQVQLGHSNQSSVICNQTSQPQMEQPNQTSDETNQIVQLQLDHPNHSLDRWNQTSQPQMEQPNQASGEANQIVQPNQNPNPANQLDHLSQTTKEVDTNEIGAVTLKDLMATNVQSLAATEALPMAAAKDRDLSAVHQTTQHQPAVQQTTEHQPAVEDFENAFDNEEEFPDLLGSSIQLTQRHI